jgi:hypothetical protein
MSYCQHYGDFLTRFKIGSTMLSLFHAEVALRNVADQNLINGKLNGLLISQDYLLRLIVSLLFNISENSSAMRKIVNKDIISPLSAIFDRRNADLLTLVLRFLIGAIGRLFHTNKLRPRSRSTFFIGGSSPLRKVEQNGLLF